MLTLIKVLLFIVFVIPIVAACIAFLLAALWLQIREEAKQRVQAAELHP